MMNAPGRPRLTCCPSLDQRLLNSIVSNPLPMSWWKSESLMLRYIKQLVLISGADAESSCHIPEQTLRPKVCECDFLAL